MQKPTPYPFREKEVIRFWSKVDQSGGPDACWPWLGHIGTSGYGVVTITRPNTEPKWMAHRIAYTIAHGQSVGGQHVCHSCDNPPCCNPAHLWLGTDADNRRDCATKGRASGNPHPRTDHLQAHPNFNMPKGEDHHKAKLTPRMVSDIRRRYERGTVGYRKLGDLFGVSPMTIKAIVTRKTWKDVA